MAALVAAIPVGEAPPFPVEMAGTSPAMTTLNVCARSLRLEHQRARRGAALEGAVRLGGLRQGEALRDLDLHRAVVDRLEQMLGDRGRAARLIHIGEER